MTNSESQSLERLHASLGIPEDYVSALDRPRYEDALELIIADVNILGHAQKLAPDTALAWIAMKDAAAKDAVELLIVSGFRSVDYQASLIRKKLAAGQPISAILTVNAAPGYSQHHTGRAVDIATPGSRPLTSSFEQTTAFDWLCSNAGAFGFQLPYHRDNRYGITYEPWHWSQLTD
jgi:D-alanyl-D-alanine carboxypeptidase